MRTVFRPAPEESFDDDKPWTGCFVLHRPVPAGPLLRSAKAAAVDLALAPTKEIASNFHLAGNHIFATWVTYTTHLSILRSNELLRPWFDVAFR